MSNPAEKVIAKCGGAKTVAAWLNVDVSRVHRWTYPKSRGGTGGVIPSRHQMKLLQLARDKGVKLRPSDFFSPLQGGAPAAREGTPAAAGERDVQADSPIISDAAD